MALKDIIKCLNDSQSNFSATSDLHTVWLPFQVLLRLEWPILTLRIGSLYLCLESSRLIICMTTCRTVNKPLQCNCMFITNNTNWHFESLIARILTKRGSGVDTNIEHYGVGWARRHQLLMTVLGFLSVARSYCLVYVPVHITMTCVMVYGYISYWAIKLAHTSGSCPSWLERLRWSTSIFSNFCCCNYCISFWRLARSLEACNWCSSNLNSTSETRFNRFGVIGRLSSSSGREFHLWCSILIDSALLGRLSSSSGREIVSSNSTSTD